MIAQQRTQIGAIIVCRFGEDGDVPAFIKFADVLRVFEAKAAKTDLRVINTVAIEVHDVIRLVSLASAIQFLAQGRQRRRAEHMNAHEAPEFLHCLDQRQGACPMVDVPARVVLGACGDQ